MSIDIETPPDTGRLRVDLFSDAVFAVAITLMVLNLPVTSASGSLLGALADRWSSFAAFGISFAIVGCVWISHFRVMRLVKSPDGALLFLNLGLLLSIVLVPFGTSTMAAFVTHPDAQSHLAAALFAAILVFMSAMFMLMLRYLIRRGYIAHPKPRNFREGLDRARPMLGGVVNTIGIGVAFISPIATLCLAAAVGVFYGADALRNDRPC